MLGDLARQLEDGRIYDTRLFALSVRSTPSTRRTTDDRTSAARRVDDQLDHGRPRSARKRWTGPLTARGDVEGTWG